MIDDVVVAAALARRTLRTSITSAPIAVPALVAPIFMLVAFVGGLSALGRLPQLGQQESYVGFIHTFMLFQACGFSGTLVGALVGEDVRSRFLRRLLLATPRRAPIVLGYALASLLQAGLIMVVLTLAALVLGLESRGSPAELGLMVALALLFNLAVTLWSSGLALRLRTPNAGMVANTPIMTAMFLAPVYVPLALLEGWVKVAASYNPLTPMLTTARGLAAGAPVALPGALALALGLAVAALAWSLASLRAALRSAEV